LRLSLRAEVIRHRSDCKSAPASPGCLATRDRCRIAAAPATKEQKVTTPPPPGWIDRFGCKLVLVLLDDKFHPSVKQGRSLWGLHSPLAYTPSDAADVITAPAGFVTDLASMPRWAWMLLPPDGPWVKAAVIHDFLYATAGTGAWKSHGPSISRAQPYTRAEADWILRDAMQNRGVDALRRSIIWAAVRAGGAPGWGLDGRRPATTDADERFVTEHT
jgi:hypothetical protein